MTIKAASPGKEANPGGDSNPRPTGPRALFRPWRRRETLPALALLPGCAASLVPPGEPVGTPSVDAGHLVMADGARLPLRSWLPKGEPRAVLLALHGFNDYRGAWEIPAPLFTQAGVALYAYDQRGHGESVHPGLWAGGHAMAADAIAATRLIAERHPGVALHLMGESMGAAVAILAADAAGGVPPAVSLILLAPAVRGRATLGPVERAALSLTLATIPWFPLTGGSPLVRPSDNDEALRAMSRDPLFRKVTRVDFLAGLVDLMDAALDAGPRFRARSLVLLAGRDDLVPNGATDRFMASLPDAAAGERRVVRYADGFHLLLRGRDRARVAGDILDWVGVGPAPDGAVKATGRLAPRGGLG